MSICLVISYTLAFLQRKACHMHSTVICISVSHISSGTTGNAEVRKQNSTRTAVLKTGIFMPSFVVLRLLSDSSFVTTEALKSSEQKPPTYLDILDSLVYRIYNSNIRAHCARAHTHTHTHAHADIVYLLVITTIKTVKNPSLCSANTILKLSTWDTDGRAKNTHLLLHSCPTSLKIKITDFPKTRQPIVTAVLHLPSGAKKFSLKGQMLLFQRCLPSGPNLPGCTAVNGMWSSKAWNPVFILHTLDFLGLLTVLPFNSFNHALNSSGTMGPGWNTGIYSNIVTFTDAKKYPGNLN